MSDQLEITGPTPLREADPFSLDELFDRVNRGLAAGLPEAVEESDLDGVVERLQAARLRYVTEGEAKARAKDSGEKGAKRKKAVKSVAEALVLDIDEL